MLSDRGEGGTAEVLELLKLNLQRIPLLVPTGKKYREIVRKPMSEISPNKFQWPLNRAIIKLIQFYQVLFVEQNNSVFSDLAYHAAALRVVEPLQQAHNRALAADRRAHEGDRFSWNLI